MPPVTYESFTSILDSVCRQSSRRVGITDWNVFPHLIFEDLAKAAPGAEFVPADDVLLAVRALKSCLLYTSRCV